jgi:hypothetical protein
MVVARNSMAQIFQRYIPIPDVVVLIMMYSLKLIDHCSFSPIADLNKIIIAIIYKRGNNT